MNIFVAADTIISPLGFSSFENFESLKKAQTGIACYSDSELSTSPIWLSKIDSDKIESKIEEFKTKQQFTRLEKLVLLAIQGVLDQNKTINIYSKRTLLILSTTKGNIDLLGQSQHSNFAKDRVHLWKLGEVIKDYFGFFNTTLLISNACISGVLAIVLGKRLLEEKAYDTILVAGVDILSRFVISGFRSFDALSDEICKPYDASRNGISLGEAAACMALTTNEELVKEAEKICVFGGASSNDANHISGPSRTGDGLLLAIEKTLSEAKVLPSEINYISGHGTATFFNDEMESLAINAANLGSVPMNSLKGYYGHTLGAAGILESVIAIHSLRENTLIGSYNFKEAGTSKPLNIIKQTTKATLTNALKTAVGFGGCNAAVLFQKQKQQ